MAIDFEKVADIDSRIASRSMTYAGDFSIYQKADVLLGMFPLKLLKTLTGLTVKQVFEAIGGADRINELFRNSKIFPLKYREEFLIFLANRLMRDKWILYHIGESKKGESCLGLAVVPTNYLGPHRGGRDNRSSRKIKQYLRAEIPFQEHQQMIREITEHLMEILKEELGQERWNKVLEMKAGSGLLRIGAIKGWPIFGDTIYQLYKVLLPIYPTLAHGAGGEAKYPRALMRDLVELVKERFPDDFGDLTERDVVRCVQYRGKGNGSRSPGGKRGEIKTSKPAPKESNQGSDAFKNFCNFLHAARKNNQDPTYVGPKILALGRGSSQQGWRIVDRWLKQWSESRSLEEIWMSLPNDEKRGFNV